MTDGQILALIAGITLITNLAGSIIGGIWLLTTNNKKLLLKIDEKIVTNRKELDERIISTETRFGETVSAIRQKVTEVELWNRDHLVSKDTFKTVIGKMEENWTRLEDKIDKRFDKLEEKIDEK